jgi:hypothetical protein
MYGRRPRCKRNLKAVRGERRDSSLPALARFGLNSRNPTSVRPAPAASGEDFVSAIGSIIDETRAVLLSAASSLGLFTLLLASP